MINLVCRTEGSGIRLITNEEDPTYAPGICGVLQDDPPETKTTIKFYNAWWYFLRQVLGISTEVLLRADFSPVRFRLHDFVGNVTPLVRIRIDRVTGTKSGQCQEWVFSGQFKIELDGLAFSNEANDFAFAREVILAFLKALNMGFVQIGGGKSIGRGVVQIENLDVNVFSILGAGRIPTPSKRHRCDKGHFAPKSTASFGGRCRCGKKIKPIWAKIPPGYYLAGGE